MRKYYRGLCGALAGCLIAAAPPLSVRAEEAGYIRAATYTSVSYTHLIGLLKAIDKFNLEFDVKFSTYAVPMITGEIKRFLRDDGMLKVSRSVKELGNRVRAVREAMTLELGREPGLEEISSRMGVSREEIAASLEAGAEVESLYKTIGNGDDPNLCLMDRIRDEREEQEQMMNQLVLCQLLKRLDEKERDIIVRRYFDNQTQSRIAVDLKISQVQVSRLEKKILRQLREYLTLE